MHYLITRHLSFLKVGMVGAVGALLQGGLLVFFVEALHLYPVIANAVAGEAAIISNFIFNNLWTFKGNSIHALPKRFVLFNTSALGSIVMQAIVVWAGVTLFGHSLYLVYAVIGIGAGWIVNYFLYTKFVWKNLAVSSDSSIIYYVANIRMPTEKAHGAQIIKTCEALAQSGASVVLVVPQRRTNILENPFDYYAVEQNFTIVRVPTLDLVWAGKLGFLIESVAFSLSSLCYLLLHPPGVVYSRDELPLWVISLFKKNTVWESHTGSMNFFAKKLIGAGKKLVVISHGLQELYARQKDLSEICVAPDGIDLKDFANPETQGAARMRLGIPNDKKIVMYIGRLDGWKGVETLFEANQYLPNDILITVVGGEPAQVESLKAQYPNVLFLGFHPYAQLADNQAAADVLVIPNTGKQEVSSRYTSPMKLFSYMASGRPIVASDLPSIREVLNEKNAVFFIPDDPRSLAETVERLLLNADGMRNISQQALRDVAAYSWSARAKTILTALVS